MVKFGYASLVACTWRTMMTLSLGTFKESMEEPFCSIMCKFLPDGSIGGVWHSLFLTYLCICMPHRMYILLTVWLLRGSSINVALGDTEDRSLLTGIHTVADIHCNVCDCVLGWKYVRHILIAQNSQAVRYASLTHVKITH